MEYVIEKMTPDHWGAVRRIYAEGIATGNATFDTEAPGWEEWDAGHLSCCRLVAISPSDGAVVGWAALGPYSAKRAYAGVAEVSVYIAEAHRGAGAGSALMGALIDASEEEDIWTLEARVFPENAASLALHAAYGFREVGRRERIGKLGGAWRDVVLLERRSKTAGAG